MLKPLYYCAHTHILVYTYWHGLYPDSSPAVLPLPPFSDPKLMVIDLQLLKLRVNLLAGSAEALSTEKSHVLNKSSQAKSNPERIAAVHLLNKVLFNMCGLSLCPHPCFIHSVPVFSWMKLTLVEGGTIRKEQSYGAHMVISLDHSGIL